MEHCHADTIPEEALEQVSGGTGEVLPTGPADTAPLFPNPDAGIIEDEGLTAIREVSRLINDLTSQSTHISRDI